MVITSKDEILYELVNKCLRYNILILNLKEYCNTIVEYQLKLYKENEYFRYVYDIQLNGLFKRTTFENKDISSYIRFFTNGDSINIMMFHFMILILGIYLKLMSIIERSLKKNLI